VTAAAEAVGQTAAAAKNAKLPANAPAARLMDCLFVTWIEPPF
jgi:hypothetical protein